VTNIDRSSLSGNQPIRVTVKGKRVEAFREFYGEVGAGKKPFVIWGSAGFLEVSARNRSAARLLGAERGDAIVVRVE
jgi:S-adenosylmethionine hydrolase